ncbi:alpha/beta hydrolase [Pseudarthrobacter sp. J64]|uniref:alpha/beta hydrolase n=1 Tax=Pseudarthrobacter sp. J64 TaxID=3116485 RepID=UPI002E80BDED|nr:alpha/beta hydrolase [Pseudarthrobacter sp. J64]MEE2568908.1 alpha/beta hydrolase [Pseudarthrobacter sp. J64]
MTAAWGPDILGPDFEQHTLELDDGAVATLVRYAGKEPRHEISPIDPAVGADVLYVHGWSDYFFQEHLARFWHQLGATFYALDLRNYGRSLRPGQIQGAVSGLEIYDEEINAALSAMGRTESSSRPLILLGHSTGGLTLSLWAHRNPGKATALILNSPWLEFQATEIGRLALAPLVGIGARLHPLVPLPAVDSGNYTRAVSSAMDGEWDYNRQWRPVRGFPLTPSFLDAVFRGQALVAARLAIDVPVLVMLSDKSYLQPRWSVDAQHSDVALNVEAVAHRALSLGQTVTVLRIPDAFHDIFLSPAPIRNQAFAGMTRWLPSALPTPGSGHPGSNHRQRWRVKDLLARAQSWKYSILAPMVFRRSARSS